MLRTIRLTLAVIFFALITLLFLDFTGTLHAWFGWMAKIQFLPAVLALNIGVVLFLAVLTLVFGRIYCSVICPLGVFQDIVSWLSAKRKKNRFRYSSALKWLRYGVLGVFVLAIIGGLNSFVVLLAPYSSYGRIVSSLFSPLYQWANNGLAYLAERADSYAFYETDVWMKSLPYPADCHGHSGGPHRAGMAGRTYLLQHHLSGRYSAWFPLEVFLAETGD